MYGSVCVAIYGYVCMAMYVWQCMAMYVWLCMAMDVGLLYVYISPKACRYRLQTVMEQFK